ncbi:MAG: polysaccharide deacetylase family protein [Desulfomonilia bacterium]
MLKKLVSIYFKYYPKTFIFCYHRVIPESIAQAQLVHRALFVTPETFENQIKWMLQHGKIISPDELYQYTSRMRFIITFDDGWKDNYTYAVKIMKKYNIASTFFITTGNIDDRELFWSENIGFLIADALKASSQEHVITVMKHLIRDIIHEYNLQGKLYVNEKSKNVYYILDRFIEHAKYLSANERKMMCLTLCKNLNISYHNEGEINLLSWNEIASMAEEGHKFGSHTHTHELLDRVDNSIIDYELKQSKFILEKKLGKEIDMFSYPNGNYLRIYIQESLRRHGFRYAFTLGAQAFQYNERYLIPRAILFEDISRSMDRYILKYMLINRTKSIWRKN